jgi:hypothetical protein
MTSLFLKLHRNEILLLSILDIFCREILLKSLVLIPRYLSHSHSFLCFESMLNINIVSPTIPQYPPTIINIEPRSRAAFPLSVRNNS